MGDVIGEKQLLAIWDFPTEGVLHLHLEKVSSQLVSQTLGKKWSSQI